MKLQAMIDELGLAPVHVVAAAADVTSAYCGDLLSDVLAHSQAGCVWFTIQAHSSIVAVAELRDIACVVLVNGMKPDPQAVAKAESLGINVCTSELTSAELCLRLAGRL